MAQNFEFTGTVKAISDVQSGISSQGKEWQKQTIVLEDSEQYPQSIVLEAFNKSDQVAKINVGDCVKAQFNLKAKEYNGKTYQTVSLWRFDVISKCGKSTDTYTPPSFEPQCPNPEIDDDGLPF